MAGAAAVVTPTLTDGICTEGADAAALVPAPETSTPAEIAGWVDAETVVEAEASTGPVTDVAADTDADPATVPDGETCAEAEAAGDETETAVPALPAGALTLTATPVPGT